MLTPTNDLATPQNKCVHKLNNCEVPLHEQNKDTFDFDDFGFPMCESCNQGYFWQESYIDTNNKVFPGFCERCGIEIEHCVDCSNGDQCLECSNELLVSPSGEQCLEHIAFCALSSSDYTVNIDLDRFECPVCVDGYYYDQTTGGCSLCADEIEGCTLCTNDLICIEC